MRAFRYFNANRDIFSSITELEIYSELDFIKCSHFFPRSYNYNYYLNRLNTERILRSKFIDKGGNPSLLHPYYFTLENCDSWFFNVKHNYGSISFELEEFDPDSISFTYGDSIPTFMEMFNDGKEYRNQVYTLKEIVDVIHEYGYPQSWNPLAKYGPENYIEVQVWSNNPIKKYRLNQYCECDYLEYVKLLADKVFNTMLALPINQFSFKESLTLIENNPSWNWFCCYIKNLDLSVFPHDVAHGFSHSFRCALYSFVLSSWYSLNERDTKTLVLAAIYHDIGRTEYDGIHTHGDIGSKLVTKYIDLKENVDFETIVYVIKNHDRDISQNSLRCLSMLKDVDALDYLRLGLYKFCPDILRNKESISLIRFAIELNFLMFLDRNTIAKIVEGE